MYVVTTFIRSMFKDGGIIGFTKSAPMSRPDAKRFRNKQRIAGKVAVISRWAFMAF